MNSKMTVVCPKCKHEFSPTEAMEKEMEVQFEKRLSASLEKERERLLRQVKGEADAKEAELREALGRSQEKLEEAQKAEIELRRKGRDLEDRTKALELEVERKLDQERLAIKEKAIKEAEEGHRLKDAEKDKKLADALAQAEELKRRIGQGSQQSQGEIFELKVEEFLRQAFPTDAIEEVAKGVKGGDIAQTVTSKTGVVVGKILWELKRTKAFSPSWIAKLKADGRDAKADILFLVTEVLPDGMKSFGEMDGVWVSSPENALPLAHALRKALFMAARERTTRDGMLSKAEAVYIYMTGNDFQGRIEAIVSTFKSMKEDLEAEKRAIEKIWAKREKTIAQVLTHISGMHGNLEALCMNDLKQIDLLTLSA